MPNKKACQYFIVIMFSCALFFACTPGLEDITGDCGNAPIVVPTLPAFIPDEFEFDPDTGLHRTGQPQSIDPANYTLKITGLVDNPLTLTYEEIRCMPRVTSEATLVCPFTFEDKAVWTGVPLEYILKLAGVQRGADNLRLIGADGFFANVSLEEAKKPDSFLAYEWEGQPLPIMHGFPLRGVFPDLYGSQWVKWLVEIEVQ